ncbi:MAG: hypothetical protein H5U19_00315 [Rhodobacteraceae bacterium]|nr:hypothetical protein [Paracoccaceae bacterium]
MLWKLIKIFGVMWWLVGFPIRLIMRLGKLTLALTIVGLLVLNMATLVSTTIFNALSGVVEAIGPRTVRMASSARQSVTYRGKKILVKEAVKDTSRRVESRVTKSTARNLASMGGEALPYVGVGVIVAATAWEIKDACSLLREMNELSVAFDPDAAVDTTKVCGQRVPTKDEVIASIKASPGNVWASTKETYHGLADETLPDMYDQLSDSMGGYWCRLFDCDGAETVQEQGTPE